MSKLSPFGQPNPYNFVKRGSFGCYQTENGTSIEFVLTTVTKNDLNWLSLARDLKDQDTKFESMIQRDIDEDRATSEIGGYLKKLRSDKPSIVYLPPILIAVVPAENSELQSWYPKQVVSKNENNLERTWGNLIKLEHPLAETGGTELYFGEGQERAQYNVDPEICQISISVGRDNDANARLIAVDGQHRLFALQYLYSNQPELFDGLVIPVSLLIAPDATHSNIENEKSVYSVPNVFRHLFVDVNSTVERVSGHFNILLGDKHLGNIICREFCTAALAKSKYHLSLVEWNTKSDKESKTISKPYTITSIGVLYNILETEFDRTKTAPSHLKHWLNYNEIAHELKRDNHSDEENEIESGNLPWADFDITQRHILKNRVVDKIVPNYLKLLFEIDWYKKWVNLYRESIESLETQGDEKKRIAAEHTVKHILDNSPIKPSIDEAKYIYENWVSKLKQQRRDNFPQIIFLKVFQQGMFRAFFQLLIKSSDPKILFSSDHLTKAFVWLMDEVLDNKARLFDYDKGYTVDSIWNYNGGSIIVKTETTKQIERLILAKFGSSATIQNFISKLGLTPKVNKSLSNKLKHLGEVSVKNYLKTLEKNRFSSFKSRFRTLEYISDEDKEEFARLLEEEKTYQKRVKEKEISQKEAKNPFSEKAKTIIDEDISEASKQLKEALNLDSYPLMPEPYDSNSEDFEDNDL